MKKKHIVQVSSYYPPHLGGQENAVQSLAEQLATAGYRVDVLTSTQGGGPRGVSWENNVRVRRMPGFVFGHAPVMPRFPVTLFVTTQPSGVIHLHIGQAFTPEVAYFVSKLRSFKYIAQLHIDFEPSGPAGILLPLYKRYVLGPVLRSAAAVVVLNQKTMQLVRDVYGCTNVYSIPNGIDDVFFDLQRPALKPTPPKILRLLFVGRLSKQKNVPCLLKALKHSRRKIQLDIVGSGDELEHIKRMITTYDLGNKVTLHGRLSRVEVMKFYKSHDALIMPSLYEAQPLVLLEAMAAQIPIIGTNVIGVAEHITGVGIIGLPTVKGLTAAIEHYYDRYEQLPAMVERGYKKAQKLGWRYTLQKYERLYESVLAT